MSDPTRRSASECGYCEDHGYTIKTVLGQRGISVECSECNGSGSVTGTAAHRHRWSKWAEGTLRGHFFRVCRHPNCAAREDT